MSQKRRTLPYLALLLLISICLTSCTPAAEINVGCDVGELIDAINDANANTDTTKLILSPNCIYPITNVDNTDGGAGNNGLPQITTVIKIEGNNAILTKQRAFFNRFFFITNNGNLRLEDITLENGYSSRGDHPNSRGGAIYNDGGAFRAERSIFLENHAEEGGAIYNRGVLTLGDTLFDINNSDNGGAIYHGGTLGTIAVIENVTFENNFASDNGGAIYSDSAEVNFLITGSTFYSNSSYHLHGGAIYMEGGDLEIYNSDFLENRSGNSMYPAGDGGAIYSLAGNVSLITNNFIGNRAYGVGGMLYAGPGTDLTLRDSRVEGSRACQGGGALFLQGGGDIQQTTLKDNFSGGTDAYWGHTDPWTPLGCDSSPGGAIYTTGTLAIDRSLIDDFYASGDGDGVYNLGDLTVVNSTFHYDCCYDRDAINNHGTAELSFSTLVYSGLTNSGIMTVKNIVVAAHTNGCINSGTFVDLDENIALDPACPFSTIFASQFSLKIDLLNLSDNGGPTLTNRVDWNSPVINMGTCSTVSGDPVTVDQRGETRPFPGFSSANCDIGAYEVRDFSPPPPPPPPPLPPTPTLDSDPEPSPSCDPFEEMEISLILLNLPPDTRNLPVYLKVAEGIFPGFELNGEPAFEYSAKLGEIQAYQVSQQGFPERLYFMFHIPEGMEGTAQFFELRLNDCPDPVLQQANVLIPVPKSTGPICTADLNKADCKAAGGIMSSGDIPNPHCICP